MENESKALPAEREGTITAQEMNESGIDYIWGSDQDELVEEKEEKK